MDKPRLALVSLLLCFAHGACGDDDPAATDTTATDTTLGDTAGNDATDLDATATGTTATAMDAPATEATPTETSAETTPADTVVIDGADTLDAPDATAPITAAGDTVVVYVASEGIGKIAVRLHLPKVARYPAGAPIVMEIPTFFTPDPKAFCASNEAWRAGFIQVAPLLPGMSDAATGAKSDGSIDYGGELSIQALADVLRYLAGELRDSDGWLMADRLPFAALHDELGLYAFSHPGIGAVNVLALHKADLAAVKWFVGRENPTTDAVSAMEVGYFDDANTPVPNPAYTYPASYDATELDLDYSKARWNGSHPYFDFDGSGTVTAGDHVLGNKIPSMYGKQIYSARLTTALRTNGLTAGSWPATLTTPEDAATLWAYRQSVTRYPLLTGMDLHVMLVFSVRDHVQILADKPHIHQAWDGFRAAGLWTRLNPDRAYGKAVLATTDFPDVAANSPPSDWANAGQAGLAAGPGVNQAAALAGIAEMADRSRADRWDTNLDAVLTTYTYDNGTTTTVGPGPGGTADFHIPSAVAGSEGIAVRLRVPMTERYASGAPVVVLVEGGWGATGIKADPLPLVDEGFIVLEFNYPGGGTGDTASGGTYDMRGPNCWGALQDVLRFAAGTLDTTDGDSLAELVAPHVALDGNIGMLGSSNGGNATILAAGAGTTAPPKIAWIVNWESPVGDGVPISDHGVKANGSSTPSPTVNPAYNPTNGVWSWTDLRWDAGFTLEQPTGSITGVFYIDADHSGAANPGTAAGSDFVFRATTHDGTNYWSGQVTTAAAANGVFPASPATVATAAEATAFWQVRNGVYWIDAAVTRFPDLMFLVIASQQDHVQSAPDYPHILIQYEGFRAAGARLARVNPDLAYVIAAGAPNTAGASDNAAGTTYDHNSIRTTVEPGSIQQRFTEVGAVLELADRTYTNNTAAQLTSVIDLTP